MRTAIQRRYNTHLHLAPKRLLNGLNKRKVKRIYTKSLANVKSHPYKSFGILVLGLSVISGLLFLYRRR